MEYETNSNVTKLHEKPVSDITRGIVSEIAERGIPGYVAERYGVEKIFNAEHQHTGYSFPCRNALGEVVAAKVKYLDKTMAWQGDRTQINMFGLNLFPSGGKFITLTEGEEDAMAAYHMMKEAAPHVDPVVLSVFNGASSAEKECKANWEYINSFENIIIAFDGDEPGQKAAEKVCRLFNYKPKVMMFPECHKDKFGKWLWKDACDYLKADRQKDFNRLWWNAERHTPKGVYLFKSLWDNMVRKDTDVVVTWPWPGLEKLLHGIRTGRFYVIKAEPKIGKSQLLKEVSYHIVKQSPHNAGVIFLEETLKTIGLSYCALELNKPIQFPDTPYTLEELERAHTELSKDDRITVFDPEDSRTVENIMAKIMYFVKAHNCKYIILDHISMLAYQSEDDNERRFLDKLCADLKGLTSSLNIAILAVTHVNDDGKTRGSRAPVQLCDGLISLKRNKLDADPTKANTTEVIVEENRLTGESGTACHLFFERSTGRLIEVDPNLNMEEFDK